MLPVETSANDSTHLLCIARSYQITSDAARRKNFKKVKKLLNSDRGPSSKYERDDEQDEKKNKQHVGDPSRRSGDPGESEDSCDNGNN
jgi:hypothetical protein